MPARKLTEAQLDRLVEMREGGATIGAIARALGCTEGLVQYQCLRLCAEPPKPPKPVMEIRSPTVSMRNGYPVRRFTTDDDSRLLAMEGEGRSVSEIARALDRRPHSVRLRLMTLARRDARMEACA